MARIHYRTKSSEYYQISDARAIDGDTIEAVIHLPFSTFTKKRIRLLHFWAPELNGENHAGALEAKANLQKYLDALPCWIHVAHERQDKYGRLLGLLGNENGIASPAEILGIWAMTAEAHKAEADRHRASRSAESRQRIYPEGGLAGSDEAMGYDKNPRG